jgi:hypothetical protein
MQRGSLLFIGRELAEQASTSAMREQMLRI